MTPDWLPPSSQTHRPLPSLTLDNCQAVTVWLETSKAGSESIIVWRDRPRRVRPDPVKPIRELVAGDVVVIDEERRIVVSVEPFR
jgi:hypothetical protein